VKSASGSGLSITTRTFLLVLAALVVAVGISLALYVSRPPLRNAPVPVSQVAEYLREGPLPEWSDRGPPTGPPPGPPPGEDHRPAGDLRPRSPGIPPGRNLRIEDLPSPPMEPPHRDAAASQQVREDLSRRMGLDPSLLRVELPVDPDLPPAHDGDRILGEGSVVARLMPDGRWRTLTSAPEPFPNAFHRQVITLFTIGLALLLPLAWLFARALASPIRKFAEGAHRLGHDASAPPLPSTGPREMRAAVEAFNAMQSRIQRLLQERTQMVAAIAHDLRTPLTRLAFRLEGLPAPLSGKVCADIQEMKDMISAALEFMRDRAATGTRERLDLRALIERIVDDHTDLGHDVSFAGGEPVILEGVPLALRRMLVNLVENALKYGARARLRLCTEARTAVIDLDDDGPGIPESRQQQVFEPFFRLESSRNRDTGGIGLGLATVRAIVMEHGGEVALANRSGGGLRVTVRLPLPG
jgi:two-component system, OmpR family, sensor kinase